MVCCGQSKLMACLCQVYRGDGVCVNLKVANAMCEPDELKQQG